MDFQDCQAIQLGDLGGPNMGDLMFGRHDQAKLDGTCDDDFGFGDSQFVSGRQDIFLWLTSGPHFFGS